jgi:hypothetical protein
VTPVGLCTIAGVAAGFPITTADAYGVGNAAFSISPPQWSQVRNGKWIGSDWSVSQLDAVLNFVDGPIGLPWKKVRRVRCDPESFLVKPLPSHRDVSPRWLLMAGLQKRLGTSIVIGEAAIMAGEGRNQEVRAAQQALWAADQEIPHGFKAIGMRTFRIANETRTGTMRALPVMAGLGGVSNRFRG